MHRGGGDVPAAAPPPPPPAVTSADDTFVAPSGKRYKRLRQLGYGTFGICWGVLDTSTKQERVAKQIFIGNMSPADTAKIRKEAELLQLVSHVNVLYCFESFDDGTFVVIITELCDGGDLAQLIKRLSRSKQSLDEQQIMDWAVQIGDALAYLHNEKRILHRDVKSSNIFLTSGLIKLGDFGIARLLDTEDRATTLAGTPHYMSPEALSGDGYDAKSDVWALGCIVYELCTYKKPFRGKSLVAVIRNICNDPLPEVNADRYPRPARLIPMLLARDPQSRLDAETFRMLPELADARRRNAALYKPHLEKRDGYVQGDDSDDEEFFDVNDDDTHESDDEHERTLQTTAAREPVAMASTDPPHPPHTRNTVRTPTSPPPMPGASMSVDVDTDGNSAVRRHASSLPDVTANVKTEASIMLSNAAASIMTDASLDTETQDMQEAYASSGWSSFSSQSRPKMRSSSSNSSLTRQRRGSLSLQQQTINLDNIGGTDDVFAADASGKLAREVQQLKDQLDPRITTDSRRATKGRRAVAKSTWHVTSLPSPYFTGRDEELQSIYTEFFVTQSGDGDTSQAKRYGICQFSGAGKTQLLLKYGWQNREAYPGGVFGIEADTVNRLQRSVAAIAHQLDGSKALKAGASHAVVAASVHKLLRAMNKRWLLLVDGANSEEVIRLLSTVYLPTSAADLDGGHILFASRTTNHELWSAMGVTAPLTLDALDPSQSAELLVRYAKQMYKATTWEVEQVIDRLEAPEREAVQRLAATDGIDGLHGIPCAIEQAGAYMMRAQCTFAQYHTLFVDTGRKLSADAGRSSRGGSVHGSVDLGQSATAWAINVEDLSVVGRRVLTLIACLQESQIPEMLLLNLARVDLAQSESGVMLDKDGGAPDDHDAERISRLVHTHFDKYFIDELVARFSIVQLDYKTLYHTKSLQREFSLDRLVRSVVRETETDASLASAEEVVLTAYYYTVRHRRYRTVTDADQQGRDELFDLSEHGLALLSRFPAPTGRMALICGTVWRAEGYISQFVGAYEEAVQRYERALELFEQYYGADGRDNKVVAETINQLGNVQSSMGAHRAALHRCGEALAMLQRVIGPDTDDATVASVLHRIATVHDELGDYALALEFYEKALSMKQRLYGTGCDHTEIASTMYRLGNVLEKQNEYKWALERYLEALHMKQRLYNDDEPRPDLAYCLFSIGSVLRAQGAHDEALVHLNEALDMRKRIYGADAKHTSIAASFHGIGECLMDAGRFEDALEEFKRALAVRVAIFGPDHKDVIMSRKAVTECEQATTMGSFM
eukprot:m.192753 g.192753  ORF g.192753 m.192753 type:complete len:1290 (+) comp18732_c0_seq1:68-3937(+)